MAHNKYKQNADEHPRPHIDVPMSALGVAPFVGNDRLLGFFVRTWCFAVWKKSPKFIFEGELEAIQPGAVEFAISCGFLKKTRKGLFLTGPLKQANWLVDLPQTWWTYAIQTAASSMVKIGRSQDPLHRLSELQIASAESLFLLGAIEKDIEAKLHTLRLRCGTRRVPWFALNDEVRAALKAWKVVSSCE